MASLTDIRVGLAANLEAILGIQVSPYMLANPTPPAGQIVPAEVVYDLAFARGLDRYMVNVQLFVGTVNDRVAQETLDGFLAGSGDRSVKQALESDKTLGGAVSSVRVERCGGYQVLLREGGPPVLMCEWTVEVLARGV